MPRLSDGRDGWATRNPYRSSYPEAALERAAGPATGTHHRKRIGHVPGRAAPSLSTAAIHKKSQFHVKLPVDRVSSLWTRRVVASRLRQPAKLFERREGATSTTPVRGPMAVRSRLPMVVCRGRVRGELG